MCLAGRREAKNVDRRGAGPMDASVYGRGAGEGFGVHICTGPVAVKDAQPGDVLEVRILDIVPRPSRNPDFEGQVFGSSVAAWWGYHYNEFLAEPNPREAVTIYEISLGEAKTITTRRRMRGRCTPIAGSRRPIRSAWFITTYDYPGVPVVPGSVKRRHNVLDGIRIPLRPHFGVIAVAPREVDFVDSIPPSYFGGNLDNWRLGKGSTIYLPVSVPGALLSVGDPHAAQGDGELGGTAIECSMTGTFQLVLHKKADLAGRVFADLSYPLIETATDWVLTGFSHPNYLAEFGAKGQSEVYATSSLDLAMKDAFRKMRRFLMSVQGPERRRSGGADVGRSGFRRHPGGGRQLGRARHPEQAPVRPCPAAVTKDACFEISHDCRRPEAGRAVQPRGGNRWVRLRHRPDAGYAGGAGPTA